MDFNPDSWPACWILELIARDGDAHEFYVSKYWKPLRRKVMRDQHGECWACKRKPVPVIRTQADGYTMTVHHVNELRQRPDLALSETAPDGSQNLVVLCDRCHYEIHHKQHPEVTPERW